MKRFALLFLGFILAISSIKAQPNTNQGQYYIDDYQFHQARSFFLNRLKSAPGDVRANCSLGDTYLYLQQPDSAKIAYQNALAADPKSPFPLIGLGKIALWNGDKTAELDYFEKARKMDKKNPEVYCTIAKGCFDHVKKDTATGNRFLTQGIELNSKYAPFHIVAGDYELIRHRYGPASNAYDRAIYFDPAYALAYRKLGVIHTLARANRDALTALAKSIELNTDQILVYKNLGDLYYMIGKYPEAEKNYRIYISRAEVSAEDKERLAIILFFNKNYDESVKLLEEVMQLSKNESVLLRVRGYIAFETQKYPEGVAYLDKFFKIHDPEKNIPSDYIYYGRLLQKVGRDTSAISSFNKALALDSTKTELYDELSKLYIANKMHYNAIGVYLKMIANGADKLATTFLIGKEYYFQAEVYHAQYDSLMNLQKISKVPFADSVAVNALKRSSYQKADSSFAIVTSLNDKYAGGFIWRGRMNSFLDPEAEGTLAKESYEKALAIYEAGDAVKNRRSIIECCRFLASYYYLNSEKILKTDKEKSAALKTSSVDYFRKILLIDPTDAQGIEVFKKLKIALPKAQ